MMRMILLALGLVLVLGYCGCASVPLDGPKTESHALTNNSDTEFGKLFSGWIEQYGQQSGVFPIVQGMDALGVRLEIADRAEKTLDLQYFLMKDDSAGKVIAEALWRAAERGVRVRFLLDDVFTSAPDSGLLFLHQHPNIEVRLFNPISRRGLHSLNFAGHFRRANRRMHNKSFTADNAISVVGGRNIADEYYQLKTDAVFADFDLLTFGPVVHEISASFDMYWNHAYAIPIDQLSKPDKAELNQYRNSEGKNGQQAELQNIYAKAITKDLVQRIANGDESLYVADARVIVDDPDKLQRARGTDNIPLAAEIGRILSEATSELIFISPYYIPGDDGIEFVREIAGSGVRMVMITNSLASTNHIPVHSAYSGYRRDVLDAGMELYEARANAGREAQGGDGPELLTLHTKLIVIDRRYLFVGSLNLDPRSIEINAEMGLLIDAPELAELVAQGILNDIPNVTYKVTRTENGALQWQGKIDGETVTEKREPLSSTWRRFKAWFLKIAPEGQL